jgi:hypothetical protein
MLVPFKLLLILFVFSIALYADATGYIELGGIAMSQKSNTEPMLFHADKTLLTLDGGSMSQKEVDPYVSFQYITVLPDMTLTTTLNEEDKLSLRAEGDTLGTEVFIRPSYEFKNPYQLYTKRATTLVIETGIGGIYKVPLEENSSLEFAYSVSQKKVSDDELGRQTPSLERNGYIHRAECSWTNNFFKLTTGAFTTQDMGSAENHKGADIKLTSVYTVDKMQMYGSATYAHIQYNDINPFFETTRTQNNVKASLSLEYDYSAIGYYTIIGVSANRQFSNTPFFNESINALFIGMGRNL